MKLITLAGAALITLSSLTAQAAILELDGTGTTTAISAAGSNSNYFKANGSITAASFNVGGNLLAGVGGPITLEYSFLGAEAGWKNTFTTPDGYINNTNHKASFMSTVNYGVGDLIDFTFQTSGTPVPNWVANGGNTTVNNAVSFATLLAGSFGATPYDAILFFDDTGGFDDDDNHDDLVIGVKVLSVPESSTLVLMMMGLLGLFAARRMKA
jgi:hypothetical protein